jgi:phosphoglycerol transferase
MHSKHSTLLFRIALFVISILYLLGLYYYLSGRVFQEKMGERYDSTLEDGINFTKPGYPNFLRDISGLSNSENWGRWSDAKDAGEKVKITFAKPLPKKFLIEIKLKAYGPNQLEPIDILVGEEKFKILLNPNIENDKIQTILINVEQKQSSPSTDSIILIPPKPTSPPKPPDFNPSNPGRTDQRLLGIGLVNLRILTVE